MVNETEPSTSPTPSSAPTAPPATTAAAPAPLPSLAPAPPIPLSAVEAAFDPQPRGPVQRKVDAEPPEQETRSIAFAVSESSDRCVIGGSSAECVALGEGPFVITHYEALPGCPDRLYLASAGVEERRDAQGRLELDWAVGVGSDSVHGARIAVSGTARLLAVLEPVKRGAPRSPRCTITWSGHRPARAAKAPTQPALMESPYR